MIHYLSTVQKTGQQKNKNLVTKLRKEKGKSSGKLLCMPLEQQMKRTQKYAGAGKRGGFSEEKGLDECGKKRYYEPVTNCNHLKALRQK